MMNPPSVPYAAPSTLTHPQALARQQALQQLHAQGVPPALQPPQNVAHPGLQPLPPQHPTSHLPQPPPLAGMHLGRKMADADAPPNVTVSTSTIPLSMAATLQQNQPPDLSSIVHQISQFCQARTGASATSVCEGQIANPSPISRNLLISASTRVSAHNVPAPLPSCGMVNPGDHATPVPPSALGVPLSSVARGPPAYQNEMKQAAAAAWNQHQLAHLQQMCGEAIGPPAPLGKPPGRELAAQGLPGKGSGYALELCMAQPFGAKAALEKPAPSPPINGLPGPAPFTNGHYFQPPLWSNVLPAPSSDGSGSQDLALPFHRGGGGGGGAGGLQPMGAAALECTAAPHCRAGAGPPGPASVMPPMEYPDFHRSCLREPGGAPLSKAPRTSVNRGRGSGESCALHLQHPGYR